MVPETPPPEEAVTPLVSVIVCAYNAAPFIAETLQTLLAQTWPRVEILVVDDGSTDATPAIVEDFAPPVRYLRQDNAGSSAARNTGIAASSGDLLCFFDADDLMPPERLAQQVAFLQRHPEVGLVICDYRNFNDQGQAPQTHFQSCPQLQAVLQGQEDVVLQKAGPYLARENFGITGTLLLRRALLAQVPGFEARLRGCEDFHFYFRLARCTPVGILNRVGMLRRIHAGNLSLNWAKMLPDAIRSYSELAASETDPTTRSLLRAQVAEYWGTLARNEANHRRLVLAWWHQLRALATNPSLVRSWQTFKGCGRALVIAAGLYDPREI